MQIMLMVVIFVNSTTWYPSTGLCILYLFKHLHDKMMYSVIYQMRAVF